MNNNHASDAYAITSKRRKRAPLLLLAALLGCTQSWAQSDSSELTENHVEAVLASSLILTDSEAITFGILSFDPAAYIPLGEGEDISEATIERRRSVTTRTLPTRWQLSEDDARLKTYLKASVSYLRYERNILADNFANSTTSRSKDSVYGGYVSNDWSYEISDQWKSHAGAGIHLLRYKNRNQDGSPALQDMLLESGATALVGEFKTRLVYANEDSPLPWEFQSSYSYYHGRTVGSDSLENVEPETWSWSNGIVAHWHLSPLQGIPNQLRLHARRIGVGGDVTDTFNTHSYYQFGVGWLFDTHKHVSWLDNIGLSVSANIGSALGGGSIALLYNEEY